MTIRPLIILAVVGVGLTVAACGGSSSGASEQGSSTAQTTGGSSTGAVASAEGAKIFASNCAQCHTLLAAGSQGSVGPDLDQRAPDLARVKSQVTNGGDGMPAFADVLSSEQIDAVSSYVADSAGK